MASWSRQFHPASTLSALGKIVKEYKLSPARIRQIFVVMVISAGMSSVCLLPAIFEANDTPTTRVGISIVGLFVSLPFFVGIYQLFRPVGVSLSLFDNGFIYRRRGKEYVTTWDEIDSYTQDSACRITKKNGTVIEFGLSIEGVDEVADVIQEQTLQRMLPQVKAAILDGSSIQFKGLQPFHKGFPGRLFRNFSYAGSGFSVDAQGITELDGGKRIAWTDVREFGIGQEKMGRFPVDVFMIKSDLAGFCTRLGLLSKAHVLLALCTEMTGLNPKE